MQFQKSGGVTSTNSRASMAIRAATSFTPPSASSLSTSPAISVFWRPMACLPVLRPTLIKKQIRVLQLINAFRFRGHQEAKLDPLGVWQRPQVEDLDPRFHELGESDLDLEFQTGSLNFGSESMKLGDIVQGLRQTYCESIGAEYMHVVDTQERR